MKSATATLQFELEKLAPAGRVGVIALATDFNIERDLNALVSKRCAIVHQPPKKLQPVDDREPA